MTIASEQQTNLVRDFLTGADGQPRPDVIVTTGMGLGEVVAKGCWAAQQELNDGKPETIIRMMAHTGTAVEVPQGEMAYHATQSTPHIHLGPHIGFELINSIYVTESSEGNIQVNFFDIDGLTFQAFKLRDKKAMKKNNWQKISSHLDMVAKNHNHHSIQCDLNDRDRLIKEFLSFLFDEPGTILFTGVPQRIAQMTSARVWASWGLLQELVPSGFGASIPEYFIRLRGEYDPAAQNADGQMQDGLPVHQTWHSQHVHVRWEELARPILTVGGPNGNETILTFNGKVQRGKDGKLTPVPALQVFNTQGMTPYAIRVLLKFNHGYLQDGRA